jgi:hypothetical protein
MKSLVSSAQTPEMDGEYGTKSALSGFGFAKTNVSNCLLLLFLRQRIENSKIEGERKGRGWLLFASFHVEKRY